MRELVGPDLPVGIALDMHGNISKEAVRHTTAMTIYRSNPHLDARQTGEGVRRDHLPHGQGRNRTGPVARNAADVHKHRQAIHRRRADEVDCRRIASRRWRTLGLSPRRSRRVTRTPTLSQMGMSFLAIADGDLDLAREKAVWMAERAWERRAEMHIHVPSVREALEMAGSHADANPDAGPVVLMDVGDNIGGGSSADSTYILAGGAADGGAEFSAESVRPGSGAAMRRSGSRGRGEHRGGGEDGRPARQAGGGDGPRDSPVGRQVRGHPGRLMAGYRFFDGGTTAVLETTDDHTLVLTSKRDGNTSREQMYSVGIWPERYRVVVAKGVVSPRPAYQPIASRIILVNTPGVTTADMSTFTYRRRRKPLYPFEMDATYTPGMAK